MNIWSTRAAGESFAGTGASARRYAAEIATEDSEMAEGESRGGNAGLAFIVGGLLVVVAIIAWFMFARGGAPEAPSIPSEVDVNVSAPAAPSGD